ncbi:MBL fold metallo-hydrolase [Specibacter cremeus]|uniref:MBL fold metallo-hydrolase n=1 Tax=Specibacter cremeus TaxID=1629051 RepID=UPI000F784E1F|nr:MBL fold metallo-hydrolase [Specibacter cremeus]
MKLVLLGTAGGPRPSVNRSAPAQAIIHDDQVHVIDCGNGVARQLALAGIPRDQLTGVYITHHHADHMMDVGALPLIAWTDGRDLPIDVYGPSGTAHMIDEFLSMTAPELAARTATTGRVPFPGLLRTTDLNAAGVVRERDGLRVTTQLVDHPPFDVALGYRFDAGGRSVVISGDTRYSSALIDLARGADVLVHEAIYPDAVGAQLEGAGAETLRQHLMSCHTTAEQAGQVATEAGVGTLMLSHLVPGSDIVTDQMWLDAASRTFRGRIIIGRDLHEINLDPIHDQEKSYVEA